MVSKKTLDKKNLYLSFVEEQGCGKSCRVRLRFASENRRKNGPCSDDPMHGSSNKDESELEKENENQNGSISCSCRAHVLYVSVFCAKLKTIT